MVLLCLASCAPSKTTPRSKASSTTGSPPRFAGQSGTGRQKPGERLPPAHDLAAVLGVNRNTVLRALRMLRDEGLLEFRRGRGITVVGIPARSELLAEAKGLLRLAREHGYRREDLIDLIENLS